MRRLLMALLLVLPVSSARAVPTAGALFDKMVQAKCIRPDSELIKPGTSDQYNAQARGFNDCLRVYVENENNKISLIRADAIAQINRITASATSHIRDVERAINTAIVQVKIVNGEAQANDLPPPGATLASFPDAACNTPDAALLKPAPGERAASLASLDRYEAQRQTFEACMRTYIAQAKNEIAQVKANAESEFRRVGDDANPRIAAINDAVTQALVDARKASGERDARVNAFHSPLAAGSLLSPATFQPSQNPASQDQGQSQPGTESVVVPALRLKRSADMPTGAGDPDAISCRAPQQLTDSRRMGPEVCKHNRDWAALFKEGHNLSPDGTKIVNGERDRTFNPLDCSTNFSSAHPDQMVTICLQAQ